MIQNRKYTHLFFDLDRTLWDFEANAREVFFDLYVQYELSVHIPDSETFFERFNYYSERLWERYRKGEIKKVFLRVERFRQTLKEFGLKNKKMINSLSADYLDSAPHKTNLLPNTHKTLEYLSGRYNLYVLTNGFTEVQKLKMKNCNLNKYFKRMITSDQVGFQKPRKEIFDFALKSSNAKKSETVMIGDDLEVDILGAKHAGIDQIYFNIKQTDHNEDITHEIKDLIELKRIL
jgi:putative hydrolase of the HAD superfamily